MNPYKILGVPNDSSEEVCKKAYRKLCAMYHPDNSSTGDRDKFEEVQSAWGILHGDKINLVIQPSKKVYMSFQDLFTFSFIYV